VPILNKVRMGREKKAEREIPWQKCCGQVNAKKSYPAWYS
jgi:hypothetical protein